MVVNSPSLLLLGPFELDEAVSISDGDGVATGTDDGAGVTKGVEMGLLKGEVGANVSGPWTGKSVGVELEGISLDVMVINSSSSALELGGVVGTSEVTVVVGNMLSEPGSSLMNMLITGESSRNSVSHSFRVKAVFCALYRNAVPLLSRWHDCDDPRMGLPF